MGVGRLRPVMTRRTVGRFPKREKARTHAIEAAQQCGILTLPAIEEPVALADAVEAFDGPIVFCDEGADAGDPLAILTAMEAPPAGVLIGPEGGFAPEERAMLHARDNVTAIPLGPRILRADTAAVAALTLVQAVRGDWRTGTER